MATKFSIKQATVSSITNVDQNINFVVTFNTNPQYPKNIETYAFSVYRNQYNADIQNKLSKTVVGDIIDIDFSIKCKEYNGKYYTNLTPTDIRMIQHSKTNPRPVTPVAQSTQEDVGDEIPF